MRSAKRSTETIAPEFPGAPIWEEWLQAKQEAKKQEVGFMRRLGRAAVQAAAVSIIVATEIPRAATQVRLDHSTQKQERLSRAVSHSETSNMVDKINQSALKGVSRKVERLSERAERHRRPRRGIVETWASNKLADIDDKRRRTHDRRKRQFESEKVQAWEEYLKENPGEEMRLLAEQKQRGKEGEINMQRTRYTKMMQNGIPLSESLSSNKRSFQSFSLTLPRRKGRLKEYDFDGSYDELAKSSVETAAKYRKKDGSLILLSPQILANVVTEKLPMTPDSDRPTTPPLPDNLHYSPTTQRFLADDERLRLMTEGHYDYVGGVATSLWKMGFMNIANEEDIPQGRGEFNPNVEWSKDESGTVFASLPYDPENELHRIIAGEQADEQRGFNIQLAINAVNNQNPGSGEMRVGLVEQPAELAQAA